MEQPSLNFDIDAGREDRERGHRQVSAKRPELMTKLAVYLLDLAKRQEFLTSDDLRNAVPMEDWPDHPNTWGAALTNGARSGVVRGTGRTEHSKLTTNRARRLVVWQSLVYRRKPMWGAA